MDKRGISPLIATVLIIGFTVALAAVIITWGTGFVQKTQEDVGKQADLSVACSTLNFDIESISCSGSVGSITLGSVSLSSSTSQKIIDVILRVYDGNGAATVDQNTLGSGGLDGFGVATATFDIGGPVEPTFNKISKVEAIAKIQLQGQEIQVCPTPIREFIPLTGGTCG